MPDLLRHALLALTAFLAYFQEAVTGCGGTAVALPIVSLFLKLETAKEVLVIQAWLLTLCIVISSRKHIVWRQYGRIILFAGIGFPVGMYLFASLPQSALKWALGVFVVAIAVRGLVAQISAAEPAKWSPSRWMSLLMNGVLVLGGVVHGAFASGGPIIMIYATKALPDKSVFRVTLCMLWLTLNSILIGSWTLQGVATHRPLLLGGEVWMLTAICTPCTLLGMVLGDRCHYRINERAFRVAVYAVLFLSGIAVLYSAARAG